MYFKMYFVSYIVAYSVYSPFMGRNNRVKTKIAARAQPVQRVINKQMHGQMAATACGFIIKDSPAIPHLSLI